VINPPPCGAMLLTFGKGGSIPLLIQWSSPLFKRGVRGEI